MFSPSFPPVPLKRQPQQMAALHFFDHVHNMKSARAIPQTMGSGSPGELSAWLMVLHECCAQALLHPVPRDEAQDPHVGNRARTLPLRLTVTIRKLCTTVAFEYIKQVRWLRSLSISSSHQILRNAFFKTPNEHRRSLSGNQSR